MDEEPLGARASDAAGYGAATDAVSRQGRVGATTAFVFVTFLFVAGTSRAYLGSEWPAQSIVDRRFNRARYDAQREAEIFAERLRHELTIGDVAHEVLGVVTKTLQPATASVWIRDDE